VANCGFFVVIVHRNNWMEEIETWGDWIMALYPTLAQIPALDLDQAFLYGGSAETRYLSKLATERPELWKGLLLLSPTTLPDLAAFPLSKPVPKLLISYGDLERRQEQIQRYQADAARRGISVEAILHKGQGHVLSQVGDAELERAHAIIRFVSDD
jgi:pimeloyl-ACP methyl ester carboxylesterase